MKQYVILTDASDNSTYGIVVKDGMAFSAYGAHRRAEEWAGWANSQEQKSLEQLLPPGVIQSTPSALHNDNHVFIKGLLDVAISGASFIPGKRSYVESHRTNAWSATPSARDFQLRAFGVDGRQNAISFKALAFKSDSGSYSFAALLRSGAVGFNPQTGLVRSRIDGTSSRHMQAKVDAAVPRGIQRLVGMNDIAHKSLVKNRDITGGQIEFKKLGQRLGSRLGGGLRAAPAGFVFIDVTGRIDADKDGIVFEGMPLERPIIPRFTVPEKLGRKISSLLEGSSEENEKLRKAGRLTDGDVSAVSEQIQALLGDDASTLTRFMPSGAVASRTPFDPARAREVIARARRVGASRVGKGGKTQINTEGSRAVEKISWDDDAKELIVTFNGGRTYTYKDVDDNWVKELESNPDFLGRILNDIKKQGFQYERGGKHAPDRTLRSRDQRRRESVSLRSSRRLTGTEWDDRIPGDGTPTDEDPYQVDFSVDDLSDIDLSGANLSNAKLGGKNLAGAKLNDIDGTRIDLTDADLTRANMDRSDMVGAEMAGANLERASLISTNLTDANLRGANLERAEMIEARLENADLREANLEDAKLNAWLPDADLRKANLYGADFRDADLSGADLRDADLRNADLSGANLDGAMLTGANLDGAKLDQGWEQRVSARSSRTSKNNPLKQSEVDDLFYDNAAWPSENLDFSITSDFRGYDIEGNNPLSDALYREFPDRFSVEVGGRVGVPRQDPEVDFNYSNMSDEELGYFTDIIAENAPDTFDFIADSGTSTRSGIKSDNWDNWADSVTPIIANTPEIRNLLSTRDMGSGNYVRIGNDVITPRDIKDILGIPSTRSASPYGGPVVSGVSLPTWDDLNAMRRIPGPTGLNEGYWFEDDSTGRIFFAKRGRSDGHAEAEVAGAAVYRVAGAGVPHKAIIKDKKGETWVVSEKVDNLQNTSNPSGRVRAQAKQDMGIDMLLQVRDAWSGGNNKMVDPIGVIYTVDTGGAGPYRAQGRDKKPEFSPDAPWRDVATMIYMPSAPISGQHISNLYGRVSNNDLVVAMRRVEHLNVQKIDQEMADAGVPPQMRKLFVDTITARQKMAKDLADEFEGYEPNARVNVVGSKGQEKVLPGGEKVAGKASGGLIPSIFRFRPSDDGFKRDLYGPSTRSVVMNPVSRRNSSAPRFSDTVDGRVVMRGKDSSGGFDAEIVLTPDDDYVIVARERNSDGKWDLIGFGQLADDTISANDLSNRYSSIDDAEAAIREYVDGPDGMDYEDAVEYLTGNMLASTRSSIADRNSGIKSARSASLAQRDGEIRLARPADGFHYADFERMSDKQLLEEYFEILAKRWEEISTSDGPSSNMEFQHVVAALRDRNMFGAVKQILDKYDMEYQASIRRGVPFQIPSSEFADDGSFDFPGKRPSLASLRSARNDSEEDSNVEISMTLSQLGDLSKDLHEIDNAIGDIDDESMSADAELGMPALYDALENAIGGVDSIVISREEFDAAKGTITGLQTMLQNGMLSKRYAEPLGRLSSLIERVDNSDGHFVTAQLAERGHMFDMPAANQPGFITKFKDIVTRAKAKGLLRGSNRSSYLNFEKDDRVPTLRRGRKPEAAVVDAYKESPDFEDNFSRWSRLTRLNSAYAKEQGIERGIAPSRAAYESSPQFLDDVRDWDAVEVARMNSWTGLTGEDDGRGNLSLRSAQANLASTRSKRVKRERNPEEIPWLRRGRDIPEGPVVEGFLYSEESSQYFDTWLNGLKNVEGYAQEQGIDLSMGEPDFQDYASSPQFLDDVQDWDYKATRRASRLQGRASGETAVDSLEGRQLFSTRSKKRSYESSDAFERGYNRFAINANDMDFANGQDISLRRMPNRNDYRYSKAFNADAERYANGIEPGTRSSRGGRTSTRSGKFVNFTTPGSGNTTPRYSDTTRGEVVSRGRSGDGNARFEVIRDRDGSYSVSGQEKDGRGKWVDVFSLDSDDEAQYGGLDNVFNSIEDAQEAINYYLTGPDTYDDFMGAIAEQKPSSTRSARSVSERKRIASIESGSSLRSGSSTAIDGLKSPGSRRIDEQDGQLWESFTPEQRQRVESRAIEMEENLIRAVSGAGNLLVTLDQDGGIREIEMLDTTKGAKLTPIEGSGKTNEFVGLFGDIADFNFWGETAQKTVTAKNKRQAEKFGSLARYQLLTTQKDPVTGQWRLALSEKGLTRLDATHGKVRELLLKKRDAIEANEKLSPGLKKTQLKDINDKIKTLDEQASALMILAGARIKSKDGRNEEGGSRLAFIPEQLPSSMRKELLGTSQSLTGVAAAKNKLFRKWAATQKGKNNKALRYNSKEYKELKAKFDAGELPEVFAWYHKQDKDGSKTLAQQGLPQPEEFGWSRREGVGAIVGPDGNAYPNDKDIVGDESIVGDGVNLDFDHSSRLWGQDVLGIPDDEASSVRGDSFWRRLALAKFIRPDAAGWVQRHNERLRKKRERQQRLERLRTGKGGFGGRAEEAIKTSKELKILKRIKADRLKVLNGKKRDSAKILETHAGKTQSTPTFTVADDGSVTLSPDTLGKFADLEILTRAPRSGELSKEDKKDEKKRQKLEKELKASNLKADRVLGSIWGINGMNERPTVVSEEEFVELAQDPNSTVIRRGFGGRTFAEWYLDDTDRHTTGDGGTLQGPGEYWAVRIEGGQTVPDGGWRGYVSRDAQGGKRGTQPGPGGVMAILSPDAKIIRLSELDAIKRDMNAVSGGIATALKDPSLPKDWRNKRTGAAADQLAELLEERVFGSVPEGDARWQTKGGQVISQLVSAVRNASNPDERAKALDALRYFVEGTNGLLKNYLAPFLGYDAIRAESGVMLVMNRGKLITFGGVGGLGMTDAVEAAVKTQGRLDPALAKKLNNGERVD